MGLREALVSLNGLRDIGIIQDYAIVGGYAANLYDIPQATYDLDVAVTATHDDDIQRIYDHFRNKGAKIEHVYIFIEGLPVQFFPNINELYKSAIEEANLVEFEGIYGKFVTVEYLIILLLTSYRDKDKIRIQSLLGKANRELLLETIKRFEHVQPGLCERYKEVLART